MALEHYKTATSTLSLRELYEEEIRIERELARMPSAPVWDAQKAIRKQQLQILEEQVITRYKEGK